MIDLKGNPMTKNYNLKNIRTYLTEGFSEEDLRQLCFDHPDFQDFALIYLNTLAEPK